MERKTPIRRGRLVLINSVLSSLPMFMLSFFEVPRGVLKKLNTTGQDSFVRMMGIKRNIGWSNGTFSANQKNSRIRDTRFRHTKQMPSKQVAL